MTPKAETCPVCGGSGISREGRTFDMCLGCGVAAGPEGGWMTWQGGTTGDWVDVPEGVLLVGMEEEAE